MRKDIAFRGVESPIHVAQIGIEANGTGGVRDPICGLPLTKTTAEESVADASGHSVLFCSLGCLDTWQRRPSESRAGDRRPTAGEAATVCVDRDPDGGTSAGQAEGWRREVGTEVRAERRLSGCCLPGRGVGRDHGHPVDLLFASGRPSHHQGGAVTVTVSPAPAQTMQGFGIRGPGGRTTW